MNRAISFIDLDKQKKCLGNKIDNSINSVLSHGQYIMGPEVNELEKIQNIPSKIFCHMC